MVGSQLRSLGGRHYQAPIANDAKQIENGTSHSNETEIGRSQETSKYHYRTEVHDCFHDKRDDSNTSSTNTCVLYLSVLGWMHNVARIGSR